MKQKLVAALLGALLLSVTGCSYFTDPPEGLVAAAEQYAAELRALPGVKSAEATVEIVDDFQWGVNVEVKTTSADGLAPVYGAVTAVRPPADAESLVIVRALSAPGLAEVAVSNAATTDIERVEVLRTLPFAQSVSFSYGETSVYLNDGTRVTDAVAGVRATNVLTSDPLDSVRVEYPGGRVSVELSLLGPSDALVGLIESLDGDSGVQYVLSREPSAQSARPRFDVGTDEPSRVADTLVTFNEPDVAGRARTRFSVSGGDDNFRGFIGLPLNAAEPDDLPPPPGPPALEPAVLAEQLAADTASITDFLATTVESSGIPGTPEVFAGGCADVEVSGQVQGTLLLKVFDYEASAQRAYDAIVAAWEAAGYSHTDQATGASIYTPSHSRAPAELSIRGTADGIQIWATGECRT